MNNIRVLVVDDQSVVRQGLVALLSFQSDIEVVGQASDGLEAARLVLQLKPDVVLLDLVMPIQDGLVTIPQLKKLMPEVQILVLSGFTDEDLIFNAIKAGANGYMLKDATRERLFDAIRDVSRGLGSFHPSVALRVMREISNPEPSSSSSSKVQNVLTRRELETLRLIGQGHSNQEIAATLVVNEGTAAKYVSSILLKLHLGNRTQAALYAVREGLIEDSDSDCSGSQSIPISPNISIRTALMPTFPHSR